MKLFSASQVREWDQFTIQHEPVASIDLMERAASKCVEWIERNNLVDHPFHIFCGKGNNGGDGLAIARMLTQLQASVTVHILEFGHKGTEDFQINLARLHQQPDVNIRFIQSEEHFQVLNPDEIVIDALFGSGLNRGLEGITADLVEHINASGCLTIAIDIPSGLFTDRSSLGNTIIQARHTLSFQTYKPAFMMTGNSKYIGQVHILDIGLHPDYYFATAGVAEMTDENVIRGFFKKRNRFAHKGSYGHALLIAGSYGKMGAAILSARSCLRSGAGLLTVHIPKCGYEIMQTALPEAMVTTDFNSSFISGVDADLSRFDAIGIGPGLGTASETKSMLRELLRSSSKPVVLDADALNLVAADSDSLKLIPKGSIITPHPKEFERLFGTTTDDFSRVELARNRARELGVIIVLKGHHSYIAIPGETGYYNPTGNAGMATAGSGDVLTGILTALLAQGYSSKEAALLGVYLHGLAGDLAADRLSMEAMIAGDITAHLPEAFLSLTISSGGM